MDEIGVFLDKSLLKKSKIAKAEIIRFIEAKWAEADDEKNRRLIHLRGAHGE